LQHIFKKFALLPGTKTGRAGVADTKKNAPVRDEVGYADEFVAQIRTQALIGLIIVHINPLRGVYKNGLMLLLIIKPYFPNILFIQAFTFLIEQ
jgi:hypothetical protein